MLNRDGESPVLEHTHEAEDTHEYSVLSTRRGMNC